MSTSKIKKVRKVLAALFWVPIVVIYVWVWVAAYHHFMDHKALVVRVQTQGSVIRAQEQVIDSLETLLHIQVVDMDGFRTLCYLKTPAKVETDGDINAG
jgi:hypothetical protein